MKDISITPKPVAATSRPKVASNTDNGFPQEISKRKAEGSQQNRDLNDQCNKDAYKLSR